MTANQERFRKLMKEQSDLTPIVDAYTEYKKCRQEIEDSLELLEGESDEDMRETATLIVEVCIRPPLSVSGTRCTRCTPLSYFILE